MQHSISLSSHGPEPARRAHRAGHSGHSPRPRRGRLAALAAIWLIAILLGISGRLAAQCVVQNGSFEDINVSIIRWPGWDPGPSTPTALAGVPGWYTWYGSPDVFWAPSSVPSNFMTAWAGVRWPYRGNNYAGISSGPHNAPWQPRNFISEGLAGTLTSSPVGTVYEVRAQFAKAPLRNQPAFMRISLNGPSGTYVVGHLAVTDTIWTIFSKFINLPVSASYNRIVIQAVDSIAGSEIAYTFVDSVDICVAEPCHYLGAGVRRRPGPLGVCCYDLLIDNATAAPLTMPYAVRMTTQAPAVITGPAAGTGWTIASSSSTQMTVRSSTAGAPIPAGRGVAAGSFCLTTNGLTPQRQIVEFLGANNVVMCRDTFYTDCEGVLPSCVLIRNSTIVCDSLDAGGNRKYKITFSALPSTVGSFPAGSSLRLRSTRGTLTPTTVALSGSSTTVGPIIFTDTPPADTQICIIADFHFTLGKQDTILCSDTLCLQAPLCPEDCCRDFLKEILGARITYLNGAVDLTGCARSGQIKRFSATIVGAYTRTRCTSGSFVSLLTPVRVYGDILSGTLTSLLPGPYYAPGAKFGREIVWGGSGSPTCASFASCAPFVLKMNFPDPPTASNCIDTLSFSIRYGFTDCLCRTCDTVITYAIPRKYTDLPFKNNPTNPGTGTTGTPHLGPFAMAVPSLMRIDMSSENDGTFSVTLPEPDPEAPAIRITGMTLQPTGVALFEMTRQGTQEPAEIAGNVATPALTLDGGQSAVFNLTYSNGDYVDNISNIVRFRYVFLSDPQEELETGEILVEGTIPAMSGDVVDEESAPPVQGVRTYVVHVDASNVAGEEVQAIQVKVNGGSTKLIAVGPVGEGTVATLAPGTDDLGNSVVQIDRSAWTAGPVAPGTTLTPVYLTFAGAANGASIDYETIDADGGIISSGSVQLGSPLRTAGVGSDVEDGQSALWPLYPNPAGTAATVGFRLHQNGTVKLSIRDLQGREVVTKIAGEQMAAGDHLISVATSGLAQGTYIVVLDVDGRTFTRTLTVVR